MVDFSAVQVTVAVPDKILAIPAADPLVAASPAAGSWGGIIRQVPAGGEICFWRTTNGSPSKSLSRQERRSR
ncbi:hypothetical protein [Methanogenium cariaci]|uniref:hypothetical protein n=1 Tax=Methanogenium cariaci TaxID=2197 RepID=UPI00078665F9|nr:hypothetical protein [Methanogenium cariaci]